MNKTVKTWLALGLSWLFIATAVSAATKPMLTEKEAMVWLEKINHAFTALDYSGQFIYRQKDHLNTAQIYHSLIDNTQHERIVFLSGEHREFIRKGNTVACILDESIRQPQNGRIPVSFFAHSIVKNLNAIQKNYRMAIVGHERVASRPATIISLVARDDFRYDYRIWVDDASSLLLKSELVDTKGVVREHFEFVSLSLDKQDAAVFEVSKVEGTKVHQMTLAPEQKGRTAARASAPTVQVDSSEKKYWQVAWVPRGFKVIQKPHWPSKIIITDGINAISVFIEPFSDTSPPTGIVKLGATHAYVRHFLKNDVKYVATVMGEVPNMTLEQIAQSISY